MSEGSAADKQKRPSKAGRSKNVVTRIATSDATSVRVGGRDLVNELIGECTYSEMLYFLACGRMPSAAELRILDACLVTLMEHGLNPSTIISRLMAHSVPGEPQVAIASGLLAVGSVFAGTTEECARMLVGLAAEIDGVEEVDRIDRIDRSGGVDGRPDETAVLSAFAKRHVGAKIPIPGFGHATHTPDDPRTIRLFAVALRDAPEGRFAGLLQRLGKQVDTALGRHLTINATGGIGALLLDIGVPVDAMRGFAVASRAGGLVGHLLEEARTPSARHIWQAAREAVPYEEPGGVPGDESGSASDDGSAKAASSST